MKSLKDKLLYGLAAIDGVEVRASRVAGGIALFFGGKEFAHFHGDNELDLRLGKRLIKSLGLAHPLDSEQHAGRSPNSPWIELRFESDRVVAQTVEMVRRAVQAL